MTIGSQAMRATHLERRLGLFSVTSIVVANMIGVGIFTTSGLLMANLNSASVMLALWLTGGVIALCGALCYGELGASFPQAGGEYFFLSRIFFPLPGFLSGWVSFIVGFSAPIAASSIGLAEYLQRAVPPLFDQSFAEPQTIKQGLSVAVISIFTLIHLRGIEFGATIQNWLTTLKVVIVGGLIVLGFALGAGDFGPLVSPGAFVLDFKGVKSAALALVWIMFAYSGWNASVYIGSEVRDPARNLPRSLILGTSLVTLLYVLLNILFVWAIGPEEMKGVISVGGLAVGKLFGVSMERFFSLLVAFALLSSISAFILLGPRVYFAMAQDGNFFRFAATIHPKNSVPALSILFQGLISIVIALTGTFDQILTYMGFALGIFPVLAVAGLCRLRRAGKTALRLPGYPVTALIYLSASICILILGFLERPFEATIAIFTVLAGIPVYFWFNKNKGFGEQGGGNGWEV